jgi:tetratricopeptide (TPR) repeat protein
LPESSPLRQDRSTAEMFYAEGWALTEMLLLSPAYSSRFPDVLTGLSKDASSEETLTKVYARPLAAIATDLRAWAYRRNVAPIRLPGVATGTIAVEVSDVPAIAARLLLADVLATAGELDRAEKLYRDLAREAPDNSDASAALGTIALRRGDSEGARREWKRAMAQGVADASLCYNYAVLADQAGVPPEEIRPALERAIGLRPDFEDARYQLALLEKNAGHYQAALVQFQAMHNVDAARAYAYWIALADTYNELDMREEALAAARQASGRATTAEERQRAAQQALIAQTDLGVQFTRDASGRAVLTTTRVPHQAADFNPFVEAGDNLQRVQGSLQQIDCSGEVMRIRVDASGGVLTLAIPDPTRVQMRNAPSEFVCGPQSGQPVTVEYAVSKGADDVLRGMEFR